MVLDSQQMEVFIIRVASWRSSSHHRQTCLCTTAFDYRSRRALPRALHYHSLSWRIWPTSEWLVIYIVLLYIIGQKTDGYYILALFITSGHFDDIWVPKMIIAGNCTTVQHNGAIPIVLIYWCRRFIDTPMEPSIWEWLYCWHYVMYYIWL